MKKWLLLVLIASSSCLFCMTDEERDAEHEYKNYIWTYRDTSNPLDECRKFSHSVQENYYSSKGHGIDKTLEKVIREHEDEMREKNIFLKEIDIKRFKKGFGVLNINCHYCINIEGLSKEQIAALLVMTKESLKKTIQREVHMNRYISTTERNLNSRIAVKFYCCDENYQKPLSGLPEVFFEKNRKIIAGFYETIQEKVEKEPTFVDCRIALGKDPKIINFEYKNSVEEKDEYKSVFKWKEEKLFDYQAIKDKFFA